VKTAASLLAAVVLLGAAPDAGVAPGPLASPAPAAASSPGRQNSLEFGTGTDHLTGNYAAWSQSYILATERGSAGRPTFYEQYSEGNRYGLHDRGIVAGTYLSAGPRTLVGLEAQTSPSHNVLPSFAGNVSVEQRFAGGFGAAVGLTHRSYTTTDASIATLTADRYVGRYRFLYATSFAHLAGTPGTAVTQTIGATMYDARGGELTLRGYAGRDVESAGNGVLVMRVSGASLSGRVPVAGRTSLTYGLDTFTQGGLYSGTGVRLGVKQNF
jgi:YaiO family outer membrane protein